MISALAMFPGLRAQEPVVIRVPVRLVSAPTTVTTLQGEFINDLQLRDFTVYDNGQRQNLYQEFVNQPISLVVAIQSNSSVAAVEEHVGRVGSVIDTLIVGHRGEAAVISFADKVDTIQTFTSDGEKLRRAMDVSAKGYKSRLLDAVTQAIDLLKTRSPNRRRVLLLVSEKRDRGSETTLRDAVSEAEQANVIIYSLDISRLHSIAAVTDLKAALAEMYSGAHTAATANPLEVLTAYTGGREYSFFRLRALEEALTRIGDELHGQYLLSFTPQHPTEGYHAIRVAVNRSGARVRSRPGYWLTGSSE